MTQTSEPILSLPLISVCIANYNGAEYIDECIRSVISQEIECPIEIIVHDDASTDESIKIISELFPQVKIIASEENAGFCISNNRMVESAKGEYILLLNNDAVLRPESLKKLYLYATKTAPKSILGLPQYTIHDGSLVDRGYEFDIFMNPIPVFSEGPNEVATVTGACLWIATTVWKEIGGFPYYFESIAEDIFLCQAARLLGYPVIVLGAPGFDHLIGKSLGGGKVVSDKLVSTTRRRRLSERNKIWVIMICYPVLLILFVLPLHFIFLAIEALLLLAMGTAWSKVNSIYFSLPRELLKNLALVYSTRRQIQANKKIARIKYISRFRLVPRKLVMLFRHGIPKLN